MKWMSPLVTLITLAFGLLIGLAVILWVSLTAGDRIARIRRSRDATERPEGRRARPEVSNDAVRGAHATHGGTTLDIEHGEPVRVRESPRDRPRPNEDAFERFLEAGRRQREDADF